MVGQSSSGDRRAAGQPIAEEWVKEDRVKALEQMMPFVAVGGIMKAVRMRENDGRRMMG